VNNTPFMTRMRGFTLIEIMVALIIFAVLSVTLLVRLGDSIRSEHYLESKTLASLIAENILVDMRIKEEWSNVRSDNRTVNVAGKKWEVKITAADTGDENLRRVTVQVAPDDGVARNAAYVFSLTGYIGRN
jgi:general secretion pathway protein I